MIQVLVLTGGEGPDYLVTISQEDFNNYIKIKNKIKSVALVVDLRRFENEIKEWKIKMNRKYASDYPYHRIEWSTLRQWTNKLNIFEPRIKRNISDQSQIQLWLIWKKVCIL